MSPNFAAGRSRPGDGAVDTLLYSGSDIDGGDNILAIIEGFGRILEPDGGASLRPDGGVVAPHQITQRHGSAGRDQMTAPRGHGRIHR